MLSCMNIPLNSLMPNKEIASNIWLSIENENNEDMVNYNRVTVFYKDRHSTFHAALISI